MTYQPAGSPSGSGDTPRYRTADFDYELPRELIAQHPAERRDQSRLMVLERGSGRIAHHRFDELPGFLRPGDLLVVNNTRVFPARLAGRLPTGGACEVFLVRRLEQEGRWLALVKPGRRLKEGRTVELGALRITVERFTGNEGERVVRLESLEPGTGIEELIERQGQVPLPPYIGRPDTPGDRERYQTVYARESGAVAAPTAGLHFTPELLEAVRRAGAEVSELTLHVGPGTFRPVVTEDPEQHRIDSEFYRVTAESARLIRATRERGGRIIAVGTTSVRTLETIAPALLSGPEPEAELSGWTGDLHPPGACFPAGGWPGDQFPPAALHPADAGGGPGG